MKPNFRRRSSGDACRDIFMTSSGWSSSLISIQTIKFEPSTFFHPASRPRLVWKSCKKIPVLIIIFPLAIVVAMFVVPGVRRGCRKMCPLRFIFVLLGALGRLWFKLAVEAPKDTHTADEVDYCDETFAIQWICVIISRSLKYISNSSRNSFLLYSSLHGLFRCLGHFWRLEDKWVWSLRLYAYQPFGHSIPQKQKDSPLSNLYTA